MYFKNHLTIWFRQKSRALFVTCTGLQRGFLVLLVTIAVIFSACEESEQVAPVSDDDLAKIERTIVDKGTGLFNFTSYKPLADKKVRVWYYTPKDDPSDIPMMFFFMVLIATL